jgi:hypothetical protein
MSQVRPSQSDIRAKFSTLVYQALKWDFEVELARENISEHQPNVF